MPTDDQQILVTGTASTPASHTIPGNGQIRPKAIFASFDGSGAASQFLPTIKITSDGGQTVGIYPVDTPVAAGGSANVSWFPGINAPPAASAPQLPGVGCINYVGAPTGNAAADTLLIQNAHDALPAGGGIVQLCRGTYELTSSNPALTFTKPIWLQGHGRAQTLLNYPATTGFAIDASAFQGMVFDHFGLINTSGGAVSGGGIHISGGGNRTEFNRIEVNHFYDGIFKQYGNGCTFDKCTVFGYLHSGIRLQNVTDTDGGDDSITNCQISAQSVSGTTAGILWESGGNLRLVGNQLFGGVETDTSCGILLSVLDGVNTSDFLMSANTIEEYAYCIAANQQGTFTGKLQSFTLWGNETFKLSTTNGDCIHLVGHAAADFQRISVGGNLCTGGVYGLQFGNVTTIVYGPNTYAGGGTGTFHDAGGTAGGVQVGPG